MKMERLQAHVGSVNAALEQAPKVLKSVGMHAAINVLYRVVYHLMRIASRQPVIGAEIVAVERRTRLDVLFYVRLQRALLAVGHDYRSDFSAALHDPHNCGLVRCAS